MDPRTSAANVGDPLSIHGLKAEMLKRGVVLVYPDYCLSLVRGVVVVILKDI
jgi:hypothetical protein